MISAKGGKCCIFIPFFGAAFLLLFIFSWPAGYPPILAETIGAAATFYVATPGDGGSDDFGDGTAGQPWAAVTMPWTMYLTTARFWCGRVFTKVMCACAGPLPLASQSGPIFPIWPASARRHCGTLFLWPRHYTGGVRFAHHGPGAGALVMSIQA